MEYQLINPRFYAINRYRLDSKPAEIYKELHELFHLEGISKGSIYSWTHQFRNEKNQTKRLRLFQYDEQSACQNLRFDLNKSKESNYVKGIQFYALCRAQLYVTLNKIREELETLFKNFYTDESTLASWIKENWKDNNDPVRSREFDKLLRKYQALTESYADLKGKYKKLKTKHSEQKIKSEPMSDNDETSEDDHQNALKIEQENSKIKSDLIQAQAKLTQLEAFRNAEKEEYEKILEQLSTAQIHLRSLSEEFETYEHRLNQSKNLQNELISVNNELNEQNQILRNDLEYYSQYYQRFQPQLYNTELLNKLNESESKVNRLELELEKCMLDKQNLQVEISELKRKLNFFSTCTLTDEEEMIETVDLTMAN